MLINLRPFFIHLLLCFSFMGLIYVYTPDEHLAWAKIKNNPNELSNLTAYVLMLAFFYANYYYLVPRFQITNRLFIFYICLILGFIIIVSTAKSIPWPHDPNAIPEGKELQPPPSFGMDSPIGHRPPPPMRFHVGRLLVMYLIGVFFSTLLRNNQHKNKLEKEKAETELRYLKAQINPHFLFNVLNSIYALTIVEKAKKSGGALMKLSGMMRYIVTDSPQTWVSLTNEIAYIKSYIELQRVRFEDTVEVDWRINGEASRWQIAPLMLTPFIENAFKYGVNPEIKAFIKIEIEINAGVLVLRVQNSKLRTQVEHHESTGMGLSNTQKRLALLYPDRHQLMIDQTPQAYSIVLQLNLAHT